jgi:hypothetical protein
MGHMKGKDVHRNNQIRLMFSRRALAYLKSINIEASGKKGHISILETLGQHMKLPPKTGSTTSHKIDRLLKIIDMLNSSGVYFKGKLHQKKIKDLFYESIEWRDLRYKVLKANDGRCELCGHGKHTGKILHVDHIMPRSKFPLIELEITNLQVLCEDCNMGKSNKDMTDWRQHA